MVGDIRGHLPSVDGDSSGGVAGARPVRVVLVDDHTSMRRTLRLLLEREDDLEVVAEADDLETAVHEVGAHRPDALVVDLRMPDGSSAERIWNCPMRCGPLLGVCSTQARV